MKRGFTSVLAVFVCLAATLAVAGAPNRVNLQGMLRDDAGAPRDGIFQFKVRIFPTETSDAAFLDETYADIPVASGIFSLEVGSQTTDLAAKLAAATEPTVQIQVNGVALPKQKLSSVMYALHAKSTPFAGVQGVPSPCGPDQALAGYENGAAVCIPVQRRAAVNSATCPAGQYLRSIAADGTPNCAAVSMSCRALAPKNAAAVSTMMCGVGEELSGGGCLAPATHSFGEFISSCTGEFCLSHCDFVPLGSPSRCSINAWTCVAPAGQVTKAQAICCTAR